MTWLQKVPEAVIRAFGAMLPRLQAEESILATERIAVGTHALPSSDARAIVARWQRDLRGVRDRATPLNPEALAAIGIGYQVMPREAQSG